MLFYKNVSKLNSTLPHHKTLLTHLNQAKGIIE